MASFKKLVDILKKDSKNRIVSHVNQLLLGRNRVSTEVEDWFHPSGAPNVEDTCARRIFLTFHTPLKKYPKGMLTSDHTPRTYRIFDNGTMTHLRWQWYCVASGLSDPRKGVGWEIPIEVPELRIRGHADGILYPDRVHTLDSDHMPRLLAFGDGHGGDGVPVMTDAGFAYRDKYKFTPYGEPVLLEIKSIRSEAWKMLHEPLPHHKIQATCYLAVLRKRPELKNLRNVCFIYENKDTQEAKEIWMAFDAGVWSVIHTALSQVSIAAQAKQLPKRICKSMLTPMATRCDWAGVCFANSNYQELVQITDAEQKAVTVKGKRAKV